MSDVWLAIDTKTNKVIGFGNHSEAQLAANNHWRLSGNETKLRKLRVGIMIYE